MSMDREFITGWSLNLYPVESMEVINDPGFEESGSITFRFLHHRQIGEISMDEDAFVIQDTDRTFKSEFLGIKMSLLCSDEEEYTHYCVETSLLSLEVPPLLIDRLTTEIVSEAVQMARETKNGGLKQFGLMADIEVTTLTEVVPESEDLDLMEEDLRLVLLQSMTMREMNSKRNPASKSSIEKLKRGFFEGGIGDELVKNCGVCLDDFEGGSEVRYMPCSHMFHEGCLLRWLEESKSCPLCRLELAD